MSTVAAPLPEVSPEVGQIPDPGDDAAFFRTNPKHYYRVRDGWLIRRVRRDARRDRYDVFLRVRALDDAGDLQSEHDIEIAWWLAAYPDLPIDDLKKLIRAARTRMRT
jgi:hypothetical protein